ncbi:MAG TPA: hypothetical protein VK728_00810 [Candidatus Sulfotelmatobacter sp.]|jgi:hypothetical protein|nr:hypothetical protein [Candidatus Sulfotelmatobacter sp.]
MAVTKVGLGVYTSDLLPHATFQSFEEARHYDKRAAQQLGASKENLESTLADVAAGRKTPAEATPTLIKAAMAEAADNMHAESGQEVVEDFLADTPELVREGEQGAQNAGTISGYLKAQGILQATVHDMRRAYGDLKSLGALHLHPAKRSR